MYHGEREREMMIDEYTIIHNHKIASEEESQVM